MSKLATPNIKDLKPEGSINFLQYNDQNRFDKIETLLDGNIEAYRGYGGCLLVDKEGIIFEIYQKSNIYAYGKPYEDTGGSTSQPVDLYAKNLKGKFVLVNKDIPTKTNEWYLLCKNLSKGIYKIQPTTNYTTFTEWYVENLDLHQYLIKYDDNYYSLNSTFSKLGQPKDNTELERWYKEYGINNINEIIKLKNTDLIPMELNTNNYYQTVRPINFNKIVDNITYIDDKRNKKIIYKIKQFRALDLIKNEIGNKLTINKWEKYDKE